MSPFCVRYTNDDTTTHKQMIDIDKHTTLLDIIPSEDEQLEADVKACEEDIDIDDFGKAEHFFLILSDIVDLSERLELWFFKRQVLSILLNPSPFALFHANTHTPWVEP